MTVLKNSILPLNVPQMRDFYPVFRSFVKKMSDRPKLGENYTPLDGVRGKKP